MCDLDIETSKPTTQGRYPGRQRSKPDRLGVSKESNDEVDFDEVDLDYTNYTIDHCCLITDVPKTYKQALSSADFNLWQFAMDEEVKKLLAKDTYEIVDLPYGEKVVPGR